MQFVVKHRLPTIVDGIWGIKVVSYHPLLTYGAMFTNLIRSAVHQVDKILKGANPGEIPIEQPTKINLKVSL